MKREYYELEIRSFLSNQSKKDQNIRITKTARKMLYLSISGINLDNTVHFVFK